MGGVRLVSPNAKVLVGGRVCLSTVALLGCSFILCACGSQAGTPNGASASTSRTSSSGTVSTRAPSEARSPATVPATCPPVDSIRQTLPNMTQTAPPASLAHAKLVCKYTNGVAQPAPDQTISTGTALPASFEFFVADYGSAAQQNYDSLVGELEKCASAGCGSGPPTIVNIKTSTAVVVAQFSSGTGANLSGITAAVLSQPYVCVVPPLAANFDNFDEQAIKTRVAPGILKILARACGVSG
jgi:hypothetical protein